MTDVGEGTTDSQLIERNLGERAGLGLLSRFLGAVFLVLLGGLLLLDRALIRANHNQATLDAQTASLLVESFISAQAAVLDGVASIVGSHETTNRDVARAAAARLVTHASGWQSAWAFDTRGALEFEVTDPRTTTFPLTEQRKRLEAMRPTDQLTIAIIPTEPGHALIALLQSTGGADSANQGRIGLLFDADDLRARLEQTKSDTRLTLAVLSGIDTVVFLGQSGRGSEGLAEGYGLVRLPTGGTWRVQARHALTTRSLRWGLWTLGVLGMLFLALGLLREQRRTLQAASRSSELERLYSDVKRANQAKSEFLANISHELRTPLNAIVGFVELLHDGYYGDLSPRQVLPVDRISASATHLRHLVDQVLDIAKIAAGRLEVHPETIVLRPFVLNVASELESLVSERELTFSITISTSLPRVRTDPTHLRQILINLIGNAVKYTTQGTVSVRARFVGVAARTETHDPDEQRIGGDNVPLLVSPPRGGNWVALQVVDTGVGIAARDLDRIFDEFEQVNAGPRGDSMHRGTGLGLAISRRLARLLGGEIGVESELGRGSTFTVWLPVNAADLAYDAVTASSRPDEDASA